MSLLFFDSSFSVEMPKSKQRIKTKKRSVRPSKVPAPDRRFDGRNLNISSKKFVRLKTNPDFIALVRIGRVVNALSFAVKLLLDDAANAQRSPLGIRNHARAFEISAGYLHESLRVFESMAKDYRTSDFFSRIKALLSSKDKKRKALIKTIRNGGGFHLDYDSKVTRATLLKFDAERYDIFTSESDKSLDFYFNLSDTVDLNHWIYELEGGLTEEEKHKEIYEAVIGLTKEAYFAAFECLAGLMVKLPFNLKAFNEARDE